MFLKAWNFLKVTENSVSSTLSKFPCSNAVEHCIPQRISGILRSPCSKGTFAIGYVPASRNKSIHTHVRGTVGTVGPYSTWISPGKRVWIQCVLPLLNPHPLWPNNQLLATPPSAIPSHFPSPEQGLRAPVGLHCTASVCRKASSLHCYKDTPTTHSIYIWIHITVEYEFCLHRLCC